MRRILLTAALAITTLLSQAKGPANVSLAQNRAPLAFMENKGQVTDQNRQPRPDIQFSIKAAPGLNIFIGNGAIHYQFSRPDSTSMPASAIPPAGREPLSLPAKLKGRDQHLTPVSYTMYRMDVTLLNANPNAEAVTEQKQDYYENYFNERTGEHGATAYTYSRITYKNIYPNIDWVLYMKDGQLEHEFVIHEGGKASDIQLKYGGATGLKVNTNGSLTATTPQGTITEQAPKSYQPDGTPVKSGFKLNGDVLGYEAGGFKGELVIDPSLVWATYYGGSAYNQANGVATDKSGNVYMSGYTESLSGIATTGAYQTTLIGNNYNTFLAKFSGIGSIQWATYYGGNNTICSGMGVDGTGDVYITGRTLSTSGIATPGAYETTNSDTSGGDAFLAKFNNAGGLLWATYFGGTKGQGSGSGTSGVGIATDSSGNVYLVGQTFDSAGIATPGAYQTTYVGWYGNFGIGDGFLAKFSGAGAIQWATYYGGNDISHGTYCERVVTDVYENVYVVGSTNSVSGIASPGAYKTIGDTMGDAFLAKFNSAGARLWATYYGGAGFEGAKGVAMDKFGNIYITGATTSTSGIATAGAYQTTYGGGTENTFLVKFNTTGSREWATYYGGSVGDNAAAITTDNAGSVYITGQTSDPTRIATSGAYQTTYGGNSDAFLAQFDTTGSLTWATYFGGSGSDQAWGIATDGFLNTYITGYTSSASAISTTGAYQINLVGSNDAFLAQFSFCTGPPTVSPISGPTTLCALGTITLTDTTTGGTWGSSNTNIATVSSGEVSGVAAGLDTITYSVTNGCGTTTVSYPVTVNAAPTVNAVSSQTVCAGDTTNTIHFTGTGTGTVYNWTCNNTSIGLAASGTGSIGSFTAVNTGNTPVVAQVTVTPVSPTNGYAYIANSGSNNVSVINTATNLVTDTINVGTNPAGVSVSPDGSKVYVPNINSGNVSVINTTTNTVVATITVGASPDGVAVSPDGSKAYVTNYTSNNVSVINTSTNAVTATINVGIAPAGISVSPDGSRVYVANYTSDSVSVISTVSNTVINTVAVGRQPYGVAISPDGSKVYVTNSASDTISVINTSTNLLVSVIPVSALPAGVAISPDGSKLYVTHGGNSNNTVSIINTATNLIIGTTTVGNYPDGVSVSPDGSKVYVANEASGNVSVINTSTNTVINTITVGASPYSLGNFVTSGTGCTGTPTTFTITVNPQPTAGITGTAIACGSVSLTATGGTTYAWSGGSTPNAAANTFTTSNTYTVTVSNGGSCSATASKAVTVNTIPTATITPTGSTTFCQGDSVILTASAGTTYLWSNSATAQNIHAKNTGSYTVVVGNANCSATSAATVVTVNALPNAAINGPTTICSGLQATLTASGGTGYSWSNGLGTNAQVNVSPTNNTTYTVTVSNANNCTATAQQTVSVTNTPTASISGPTEVCSGNGITLTANGGNSYSWAGGLGSNAAINISPTSNTTYTVTATIGVNCSATASQTVTVNQPGASQFSQSICAGSSYSFNSQNLTAGGAYYDTLQTIHTCDSIVTLNLTVNNAVQTTVSDTTCKGTAYVFNGHNLNQAGIYKDTLNAANTCDSIVTLSLIIDSVATPTITRTGSVLQTQTFASYQWLLNGAPVSGTGQSFTLIQDGNYSVVVTGANGCSDTSVVLNVTGLGVNDMAAGYGVKLYPNPNNGSFVLEFTDDVVRDVEITDAVGRTVMASARVSRQQNFNVEELSAGIYIVRINQQGQVQSLKFTLVR